jgi:hypothetical protein
MRTTITMDDHLLAKVKKRASESGVSVSRLIEQAVRLLIQAPPPTKQKEGFELVTFGAGGHFTKRNIDKTSSLLEDEDVDRFARRR